MKGLSGRHFCKANLKKRLRVDIIGEGHFEAGGVVYRRHRTPLPNCIGKDGRIPLSLVISRYKCPHHLPPYVAASLINLYVHRLANYLTRPYEVEM